MPVQSFSRCMKVLALGLVGCAVLATPAQAQAPAEVGQWSSIMNWPVSATHTSLQPDGKVMFFGEFADGEAPPRRWDPVANTLTNLPVAGYNIFCSGHSLLADGKLLVTGGHLASHEGLSDASFFDPFTNTWTRLPDMNDGRWYPTNTTLPNGDVMVISGEVDGVGDFNVIPQRYIAATRTWKNMTGAKKEIPYYPRMFVAPNGKLFCASPPRTTLWMDLAGNGSWKDGPKSLFGKRTYGPAVLMDGKVVMFGGGDPPTATVEMIDLTAASPAWKFMAPMSIKRRQNNATLLPDGTVLITGGSSGDGFNNEKKPVLLTELWDPDANKWTKYASNKAYRGYHSTALLLPDGRVLSAGGTKVKTAEIFSPPYLFKGTRPTIGSAPGEVAPGATFNVGTPDAARIKKVTLIALGAVTHAFDQNQRLLTLNFTKGNAGLTVTAPANNNWAPPGYYQLFLVNDQGVPSISKIVRVTIGAGVRPVEVMRPSP
jgi:hypothetical protein